MAKVIRSVVQSQHKQKTVSTGPFVFFQGLFRDAEMAIGRPVGPARVGKRCTLLLNLKKSLSRVMEFFLWTAHIRVKVESSATFFFGIQFDDLRR
jgi:hypothetical protein